MNKNTIYYAFLILFILFIALFTIIYKINFVLMFLRPEASILWELHLNKSPIVIFIIVMIFTTALTCFGYYGLNEILVRLWHRFKKLPTEDKPKKEGKLAKWNEKIIRFFQSKGKYLILIPFTFPIIPGIDAAIVVSAKSLKINIVWFLIINAVKFALIIWTYISI